MPARFCIHFPTLPTDAVLNRFQHAPDQRPRFVLLTAVEHQREAVASCCPASIARGVHPGMTLAHARALLPAGRFHVEPFDHHAVARTLSRLAHAMLRVSPVVALDPPDTIRLDARGCTRLHRSPARLAARLLAALHARGFDARIAAARTWGAAWGVARHAARRVVIVPDSALADVVRELPIEALRLEPLTLVALHAVGVTHTRHLLNLPRRHLADRFGPLTLLRLDQALGNAEEIIDPIRPRVPVEFRRDFDGPTTQPEAIALTARGLIEDAAARLHQLESGCRRLILTLERSDIDPLSITLTTSHPTRDPSHLWALARHRVESAPLGFGVEGVAVRAELIAPLPHAQPRYAQGRPDPAPAAEHADIGRLIDILQARLGPDGVRRPVARESHFPERAYKFETVRRLDDALSTGTRLNDADRPSLLHEAPRRVEPTLLLPDGPIAALRFTGDRAGEHRRVTACDGPERLAPEWWRDEHPATQPGTPPVSAGSASRPRDYFKVQTDSGRWLWLYREHPDEGDPKPRWFIHGEWT